MTKREKTIATIVAATIGLYALYEVLLSPQLDRLNAAEAKAADHREALDDAYRSVKRSQTALRVWNPLAGNRIKTDASAAESQLRESVLACARDASVSVPNYQSDKSERVQGYDRSQLSVTVNGNMRQISRFLFELQNTNAPLRIETVQIKSRVDGADDLQAQIKLSTIYQQPAPAKIAAAGSRDGSFQ